MPGAGGGGAIELQQPEPEPVSQDRSAEHQKGEGGGQRPARRDVAHARQRERQRRHGDTRGQILHAIADPQAALRRQPLEQDGAGNQRGQRGQREQHALPGFDAERQPMPDDEGDADHTEREPGDLAPSQRFVEQQRCQHRGHHRIGADDQSAQPRRNGLHAGVGKAEIERIVGKPQQRAHRDIAPAQRPVFAEQPGKAKDQHAGQQEPRGQQQQRRAIGNADLAGDKGKTPQHAEQHDLQRPRQSGARGDGNKRGDRHAASSWPAGVGRPLLIWKLNDRMLISDFMNGDHHARSRSAAQLRCGD